MVQYKKLASNDLFPFLKWCANFVNVDWLTIFYSIYVIVNTKIVRL